MISYKIYGWLSSALITAPPPIEQSLPPNHTRLSWYRKVHRCCRCQGAWIVQQVAMLVHFILRYGFVPPAPQICLYFSDLYPEWAHALEAYRHLSVLCLVGGIMLALLIFKYARMSQQSRKTRFDVRIPQRRECSDHEKRSEGLREDTEDLQATTRSMYLQGEHLRLLEEEIEGIGEAPRHLRLQEQPSGQHEHPRRPSRRYTWTVMTTDGDIIAATSRAG